VELTNFNKDKKLRRKAPVELGSMMYGKVPPQAKELEEAVLGAIMLEKSAFDVASDILQPESFYVDANQRIFRAMQALASKNMPIDLLTVVEALKSFEELDAVGGPFYVTKLTNARIVLQKYIARELIRIGGEVIGLAYEDSTDIFDMLNNAEDDISNLRMGNIKKQYKSLQAIAVQNIQKLEELRISGEDITGVTSGFKEMDMVTCGWQSSDLVILAARPSVGKTAFALTLAKNATRSDKPVSVGIFSLEMKDNKLVNRIISQESGVWLWRFKNGKLDDQNMKDVYNATQRLSNSKIFIDDTPALSIHDFKSKARMMKRKENIGMIIVDYLQLMTAPGIQNREQQISTISQGLKTIAKELDIPVIALSQLSRELEKGGPKVKREPQLSDLRESGAIEQDADIVMFLYKPTDAEVEEDAALQGIFYCKIEKNRDGALAKFIGKFHADTQTHEYLRVVHGKTLQPLGENWKPVDQVVKASPVDFSQPTKEQEPPTDDLPF
jgi:replicative DNA helicase